MNAEKSCGEKTETFRQFCTLPVVSIYSYNSFLQ